MVRDLTFADNLNIIADYAIERIILLRHIVLIIAQPSANKQPPMHNIDITRLEEITNLAIGSKLDSEGGRMKRRAVREFFKLAKQYERFANGEIGIAPLFSSTERHLSAIDGSTVITVVNFHDQNIAKSPGSGSGEDFRAVEVNDGRYSDLDPTSSGIIDTCRSTASNGSHVQEFFPGQPGENNISPGIGHYRQQFHTFPSQQQTVEDQLSYTHASSNQTHASNTLARLPSNYQNMNGFAPNQSRRSSWLLNTASNPSCSPNLALNQQPVHNNSLAYSSFQDTLHLPVNLNIAQTPYMPQSPSMQLPTANFQPHEVLSDAIQGIKREPHTCDNRNLNQYSQHIHGLQVVNNQAYSESDIKENQIRINGAARGGYSFKQIADERNRH